MERRINNLEKKIKEYEIYFDNYGFDNEEINNKYNLLIDELIKLKEPQIKENKNTDGMDELYVSLNGDDYGKVYLGENIWLYKDGSMGED